MGTCFRDHKKDFLLSTSFSTIRLMCQGLLGDKAYTSGSQGFCLVLKELSSFDFVGRFLVVNPLKKENDYKSVENFFTQKF